MKKLTITLTIMLFATLAFANSNNNTLTVKEETQITSNCVTTQQVFSYLTARGFHPITIRWNSEGNAEVGTTDAWAPVVIVLVQNCTIVGHTTPPIQ